jgi:hypothetical protein
MLAWVMGQRVLECHRRHRWEVEGADMQVGAKVGEHPKGLTFYVGGTGV